MMLTEKYFRGGAFDFFEVEHKTVISYFASMSYPFGGKNVVNLKLFGLSSLFWRKPELDK